MIRRSSKMKLWLYGVLKQLLFPVWQVGPLGWAFMRIVSLSQSICVLTTSRKLPLSSPLVHNLFLLLEKNVTRPSSRSEEHTSELQSLMRISYAVFCLKKKTNTYTKTSHRAVSNNQQITKETQELINT